MLNTTYNIFNTEQEGNMSILTESNSLIPQRRPGGELRKLKVRPKHRFVLELHLTGYSVQDKVKKDGSVEPGICTLTGYTPQTVYGILNSEAVNSLRQQINLHLDKEFDAQYQKVIKAVSDALDESKPDATRLQGARLWGEFHKRFNKDVGTPQQFNITAEDVVFQIMNGEVKDNG